MNEQSVRLNYIFSLVKLSFPCPKDCMHTTVDFCLLSTYRSSFWWRENVLGTVWYIFRFQDGYELPEHGGLFDLFVLEAELLHVGRAVILPHWSELSMQMWFFVFRRHWVAGAGSECREHPWDRLLLAKDVTYSVCCKSLISNTQLWCILFCFVLQIGSRAVLITGCDSGFGFDLAKHLHDKGFIIYAGCLQKVGETKTVLHLWHVQQRIATPVFPLHCTAFCQGEGGWLVTQRERHRCLNFTEQNQEWMVSREVLT